MRLSIFISFFFVLAACEAVSEETPTTEFLPVVGTMSIGAAPVKGAVMIVKNRTTFSRSGQSGYIETEIEAIVDYELQGDLLKFRLMIKTADVSIYNLKKKLKDISRAMNSLEGKSVDFSINMKSGELQGQTRLSGTQKKQMATLVRFMKRGLLSGKNIVQGQEVYNFDLKDFLSDVSGKTTDGFLAARVIGQSVYNERPVVVLKAIGDVSIGDQTVKIDSVNYVDAFTGISVFGTVSVNGINNDGIDVTSETQQSIDLSDTYAVRPHTPLSVSNPIETSQAEGQLEQEWEAVLNRCKKLMASKQKAVAAFDHLTNLFTAATDAFKIFHECINAGKNKEIFVRKFGSDSILQCQNKSDMTDKRLFLRFKGDKKILVDGKVVRFYECISPELFGEMQFTPNK